MKTTITVFFAAFFFLTQSLLGQTPVSGNITANTTWTVANSPYVITGYTHVNFGVTLTIEPGVVVEFDDNVYVEFSGDLAAVGTASAMIQFTSSNPSPFPGIYYGFRIYRGNHELKYVKSEYAETILFSNLGASSPLPSVLIENSIFSNQDTAISLVDYNFTTKGDYIIRNCTFESNTIAVSDYQASIEIENCIFKENEFGAISAYNLPTSGFTINNSIFEGNDYGAVVNTSKITNSIFYDNTIVGVSEEDAFIQLCTFIDNEIGISTLLSSTTFVTYNNFENNVVGVRVGPNPVNSPSAFFKWNTICNSQLYNAEMDSNPGITADLSDNCWCETDIPTIAGTIFDSNDDPSVGTITFSPIDNTICSGNLVYPGDANYDQVANAFDILAIGVKYNEIGPTRLNASLAWVGQAGLNWADTLSSGINLKHTDCNGDGVIDSIDIDAINLNYGLTHTSNRPSNKAGVPLAFKLPAVVYNPGDSVTIEVSLGTLTEMADSLYGVAFSVLYDSSLVEEGSISVSYANSWLGTKGSDMISIDHDSYVNGQIDIGLTRIDHLPQSGFGTIAEITIVIDEDIAKTTYPLAFSFGEIRAVNPEGKDIPLEGESVEGSVTTGISDVLASSVHIFPNPANNLVEIQYNSLRVKEIQLITLSGKSIYRKNTQNADRIDLRLNDIPSGLYFIKIIAEEGTLTRKLTVVH